MAFKLRTGSLLQAADSWNSRLFGSLIRRGRDVIEGVISWGERKGVEAKAVKWRIGSAKAEVYAPLARSSAPALSIACRTQKSSTVVKNLFSGFFLRSHPESLASKYAAKITPQPYWSSFRSPEQFRSLGKRLGMYSFVGLSFAANCQRPEFMSKDHVMDFNEVCNDIRKMFSDRLVYGASCMSVERMEQAKLDDYEIGQLMMTSGHTACFEAKIKSSLTDNHLSNETVNKSCSFEVISDDESDVSFVYEEDSSEPSDIPSLESEMNQVAEIMSSQEKQLHDIYKAVCGQNEKLLDLVNQFHMPTDEDNDDSGSDSSIEVIGSWQNSYSDQFEEKGSVIDGCGFDDDDDDSIVSLDLVRQLDEVTVLAEMQQMEITELLASLLDQNRRIEALASSCKPVNDFSLIMKVRWMIDCSLEYAAEVLTNELLPACEYYSVDQDWSRSGLNVPAHFNVTPVIAGFLTTVHQLKDLPACHDALPCVSSWQQDIAVCIVTKRYELTLAEFLASHEPGVSEATLLLLQLLEAVVHLGSHRICHRDLKSDNIFIEQLADGPHLLVANFGSSLQITTKFGFPDACDANDMRRCSCSYLMAPECSEPRSPLHQAFTKADLWTCGAIAYEVFGSANPFRQAYNGKRLTNSHYQECDLPDLPGCVPSCVNGLVKLMLKRDPKMRPDPELIANALHLILWAPQHWKQSLPSRLEINRWITKFAAETFLLSSPRNVQRLNGAEYGEASIVNALKVQFLSRVNSSSLTAAVHLLWDLSAGSN